MCTQLGLEQDTLGHNAPSGTADNEKKALDKSKLWTLSNMQHARSSLTNKKGEEQLPCGKPALSLPTPCTNI